MTIDFVAGAVGFTYTWNPSAGQPGNITTLTGMTCTMIALQSGTRKTFTMNVAGNGETASYTTQAGDFPSAGPVSISFQAVGNGIMIETPSVIRNIGAPL